MHTLTLALLAFVLVAPAEAQVRVNVDIGIRLPAPPQLVVVPEVGAVRYAPAVQANLFFYNNQYWAFASSAWHVSARFDGPWIVVAPQLVPRPVLLVPVRYYHVPPGHWKKWEDKHPPRWQDDWGRDWADKRAWKRRDRDDDDDRGKKRGRGRGRD